MKKFLFLFLVILAIASSFYLQKKIQAREPVYDEKAASESASEDSGKGTLLFPPPIPSLIPPSESISLPSSTPPSYYTPGVYLLSLFDKKGSAYIAGKIVFDEADKEVLRDFTFMIPGKEISLVRVVHEKWSLTRQCPPIKYQPYPQPMPMSAEVTPAPAEYRAIIDYQKPECYENYVSVFTTLSPESEETKEGLKVTVNAPVNLSQKSQESLLFLYQTKDYSKKFLTNYYYHLPTPRIPISVASVQVGILVKDGLRLRGTPIYPNYGSYLPNFRALEKARNLNEEENQELANFSNDIMYQGVVRKTDSDLEAETSFVASGIFGSFWPFLYLREAGIGFLILGFIVAVTILLFKFLLKIELRLQVILLSGLVSFITTLIVGFLLILLFLFLRSQGVVPL